MNANAQAADDEGTRSPVAKFVVSSFAALCAVFFPQIVLYLKHSENLKLPTLPYLLAGVAFALVIGVITLIFEHGVRRTLAQTFMAALGVPAILSGTLGTVGLADNALQVQQDAFHQQAQDAGIGIGAPVDLGGALEPQKGTSLEIISSAYAADVAFAHLAQAQAPYAPQFVIPRYLIVLDRESTESAARARAQALRQHVPDATVIRSGNDFLVVVGDAPLAQADALARAGAIKRSGVANPTLAPVRTQ